MQTLIECVPNFSEGRDAAVVESIVRALLAGPDVYLLDRHMDPDHNRSVVTFVGTCQSAGKAALRAIAEAAQMIDLNHHTGVHPRLGATDVVPFIPLCGASMEDCVHVAEWVAEQTWRQLGIPTYLYGAAARRPDRSNLENVRRGQFERLREEIQSDPARHPDFGEAALHPTAGATAVGARKFLIAYNIRLSTPDVAPAQTIARRVRASTGGLPCLKAMGVELKTRHQAQVSMNLTDFETTSLATVFNAVSSEAAALGIELSGSEIVGLVPRQALTNCAAEFLRIQNFRPESVLELRLEQVLAQRESKVGIHNSESGDGTLRAMVEQFVSTVAAPTPVAAGGTIAALSAALAAALAEMVCGVSLKRKSLKAHHQALETARARLSTARELMMHAMDRDRQAYEGLIRAGKLPAGTPAEQDARRQALELASQNAAAVPLEVAESAASIELEIDNLAEITIVQTAADLKVAATLAASARRSGTELVRANLPGIVDLVWRRQIEQRLEAVRANHPV